MLLPSANCWSRITISVKFNLAGLPKLRPPSTVNMAPLPPPTARAPLTDGAAAVILMTESRAKELGLTPLSYLRSYAFTAIDVWQDMLLGPAWSRRRWRWSALA